MGVQIIILFVKLGSKLAPAKVFMMRKQRHTSIYFCIILLLFLCLSGCRSSAETAVISPTTQLGKCENQTIENTAEDLANCLPQNPSIEQVEAQLREWQRIDDGEYWGDVLFADILPGGDKELIITYHNNLQDVIWNPQGMFAVLQHQADGWQIVFESPIPTETTNIGESLQGNWAFHIQAAGDVSGDGFADLILKQYYSNGTHSFFGHTKLITTDQDNQNELAFIYIHPLSTNVPQYSIEDGKFLADLGAIQRWYQYEPTNGKITIAQEEIDQNQATLTTMSTDGAAWFAFDERISWLDQATYALYRQQNEQLNRYDLPFPISYLGELQDSMVYVGGAGQLRRFENDIFVDVLAKYAPLPEAIGVPVAAQLADDGSLWVAAEFRLWELTQANSQSYEIFARNVMISSDGSVWAMAWDGVAENLDKCCFVKIDGTDIERYWFDQELPVPPEVEAEIRAMQAAD